MKVIDLLNKIANGEEVPKRIRITAVADRITKHYNFFYDEDDQEYKDDELFSLGARLILDRVLNEKVEIIEEDKKIEKLNIELNTGDENKVNCYTADNLECDLAFKINEIIDYLEEDK